MLLWQMRTPPLMTDVVEQLLNLAKGYGTGGWGMPQNRL